MVCLLLSNSYLKNHLLHLYLCGLFISPWMCYVFRFQYSKAHSHLIRHKQQLSHKAQHRKLKVTCMYVCTYWKGPNHDKPQLSHDVMIDFFFPEDWLWDGDVFMFMLGPLPFIPTIVRLRLPEMMSYKTSSRSAQCFPAFFHQFGVFVIGYADILANEHVSHSQHKHFGFTP